MEAAGNLKLGDVTGILFDPRPDGPVGSGRNLAGAAQSFDFGGIFGKA